MNTTSHRTETLYQEALEHIRAGRTVEANVCFHHILRLDPEHEPSLLLRALLTAEAGDTQRAYQDLETLLTINPSHTTARHNRGILLAREGESSAAIEDFKQVLTQAPEHSLCRADYARTLIEVGHCQEALAVLDIGLSYASKISDFHNLRGQALCDLGRLQEALEALLQAKELNPTNVDTLHALGLLYDDIGRPQDAITTYTEALHHATAKDRADIILCRGFSHMMLGQFDKGWIDFGARTKSSRNPVLMRHAHLPHWQGQNLGSIPLIIHAEQGFGDSLQFARFISYATERTGHIVVEVPAPLIRMFQGLPNIDFVTDNAGHVDGYQCSLLDLPRIMQLGLKVIAPVSGYLTVAKTLSADWLSKMPPAQGRLRLGIAWQGRQEKRRIPHWIRGVPLKDMLSALPEDAEIYPFQKDITPEDASILSDDPRVHNLTSEINDFADSAAIVDAMDMIITIDTAPAHMALALGKPVNVLLPYSADWRWMQAPNTTPWYPNARLFRQSIPGNWTEPLSRLRQILNDNARPY